MIKKLLFGILLFAFISNFAQETKRWNVENNYSVIPSSGFGGDDIVIDLGIKYRFLETNFVKLGVGLNAGYITENSFFSGVDPDGSLYIFQPRAFSEFNLPFSKRLRLSLGAGYSFFSGSTFPDRTVGGFNFNISLIYDISDQWFVQLQYDFVGSDAVSRSEGFNNFRLGVGFRF
jgi:hypothetical protein